MPCSRCTPFRSSIFGFFFGITSFLWASQAHAQDQATPAARRDSLVTDSLVTLTGAVFSNTGQVLVGATVEVSGLPRSMVSTNAEGYFLMPVKAYVPLLLIVSFPQHEPQHVEVKRPEQEKNLVVTLQSLVKPNPKPLRTRRKQFQRNGR